MIPYEMPEEDREIIRHYEEAVSNGRLDYFDVDEMEIIIEHYLYDGDIRDAQKALAYAFQLHPGDDHLQCQKAAILSQLGKLDEALELIERYRDEDDPVQTYNRAEILYKLGRRTEALSIFHDLTEENTDDDCDTKGLCSDIIMLLNRYQDYSNCLYFFEKGLAACPNDLDFMEAEGLTYENLGEHDKALELYNKVLDINPYRTASWLYIGALYFEQEKFRNALEAYDYALAIDTKNAIALAQKAYCLFNLDAFAESAKATKKYLEFFPEDDALLTLLGDCYDNLGKHDLALVQFLKAAEINPDNNGAWFGATICKIEENDLENATIYLQKALEINAQLPEYHVALAEIKYKQNNAAEAILALQKALELDNANAFVWQKIGELYFEQSDFASAIEAFETAIKHNDKLEKIMFATAAAYYGHGDLEEAQHYYDKAKRLDENIGTLFLQVFPDAEKNLIL